MSINKNKILFSILAGGQSKRFGGGYKTFTKISGKTMLDHIIKKLSNFSNDIIINANNLDEFKVRTDFENAWERSKKSKTP